MVGLLTSPLIGKVFSGMAYWRPSRSHYSLSTSTAPVPRQQGWVSFHGHRIVKFQPVQGQPCHSWNLLDPRSCGVCGRLTPGPNCKLLRLSSTSDSRRASLWCLQAVGLNKFNSCQLDLHPGQFLHLQDFDLDTPGFSRNAHHFA